MKRLFTAALICFATFASAEELIAPQGRVILTVSGQITNTNGDGVASFDREMLDGLEQRTTTAATPWLEGIHAFKGPLGAAILDAVGAKGQTLSIVALNDYSAEVPTQDFHDFPVIFATHIDGEVMSVREKGPFFMIYPFDEHPELFNEIYFERSVWQIARIDVRD